ncbi:MAG: hypothetical protein ACFCUN_04565, partial [Hyphomicrobiaceae bacterium]
MTRRQPTALITSEDDADDRAARWSRWSAFTALAGIWALWCWPWLSGDVSIPWDGKAHFAPQVQFMAASIGRGEWPWWNPYVFAGHPQIADPQAMLFVPPMILLALADPAPSPWAIDVTVLAMVLFGGGGVIAFGHRLGWTLTAAVIAALVFMFGGSMAWRLQHFGQVISLTYLPWTLLLLHLAIRDARLVAGLGAGVLAAFMLLGRDQVALLGVYVAAAFGLTLLLTGARVTDQFRLALPALIIGASIFILIVAVPLGLTLALAEHSNRPTIDYAGAAAGSLHPALLATLAAANLYGSAGEMANFWGPPSFAWRDTGLFTAQNMGVVYISAAALLVIIAAVLHRSLPARASAFFVAAAAFALVYALGWFTPAFATLYDLLPGVDKFRRPADATFILNAMLAFIVGAAMTQVDKRLRAGSSVRLKPLVVAALVVCSLAVAIAIWRERTGQALPVLAAMGVTFAAALVVLGAWRWLSPIRPVMASALVIAAVALDLRLNNGPNGATALPSGEIGMLDPRAPPPTVEALRRRL